MHEIQRAKRKSIQIPPPNLDLTVQSHYTVIITLYVLLHHNLCMYCYLFRSQLPFFSLSIYH